MEILVVVAIIAVIVASSTLAFVRNTASFRLRTATRTVFQSVRHARSMALLKQKTIVMQYENYEGDNGSGSRISESESKTMCAPAGKDGAPAEENEAIAELMNAATQEFGDIHIKVEFLEIDGKVASRNRVSVFSNVDFLLGNGSSQVKKGKSKETSSDEDEDGESPKEEIQQSVSVLFEPNGRCRKHRISIYPAGGDSSDGTIIEVDLFGNAKVVEK